MQGGGKAGDTISKIATDYRPALGNILGFGTTDKQTTDKQTTKQTTRQPENKRQQRTRKIYMLLALAPVSGLLDIPLTREA